MRHEQKKAVSGESGAGEAGAGDHNFFNPMPLLKILSEKKDFKGVPFISLHFTSFQKLLCINQVKG